MVDKKRRRAYALAFLFAYWLVRSAEPCSCSSVIPSLSNNSITKLQETKLSRSVVFSYRLFPFS